MSEYPGYPDSQGWLHPNQEEALKENQRLESDFSRGYSGNCPQDPTNVPQPQQKPQDKIQQPRTKQKKEERVVIKTITKHSFFFPFLNF